MQEDQHELDGTSASSRDTPMPLVAAVKVKRGQTDTLDSIMDTDHTNKETHT